MVTALGIGGNLRAALNDLFQIQIQVHYDSLQCKYYGSILAGCGFDYI